MRVSVVNFCSTALDMLEFSSRELLRTAGTEEFDYLVVTWNPSPEVQQWLEAHPEAVQVEYPTDPELDYVPNLRQMFNRGFQAGCEMNDYVCIVNTDMAFGTDWLINLMRRATPEIIPNSLHLSPIIGSNIISVNCGIPTEATFDVSRFKRLHDMLFEDKVETEEQRGGWRNTNTMPYIVHKQWWEKCGPWRPNHVVGQEPPDRQFFRRIHEAGGKYVLCRDSICYHHEAVERRSKVRPVGIETMPEGV